MAADRTDIYVLTDGSHGNPAKTVQEEAAIRKRQFEAEMEYVRPIPDSAGSYGDML